MDPSLPAGHAFWVSLQSRPTGLYFCAGMPHGASKSPTDHDTSVMIMRLQLFSTQSTAFMAARAEAQHSFLGKIAPLAPAQISGLVAGSLEAAEGWVDAILMVAHIAKTHQLRALEHALTIEFPA